MSKCPKCERVLTHVNLESMDIRMSGKSKHLGVAYACPWCATLLGVGIDPVVLKNATVDDCTERFAEVLKKP